jgi:hypothetical protein
MQARVIHLALYFCKYILGKLKIGFCEPGMVSLVIQATLEAEVGGSWFKASLEKKQEALSENKAKRAESMAQVEHLLSKHTALSSISSVGKQNRGFCDYCDYSAHHLLFQLRVLLTEGSRVEIGLPSLKRSLGQMPRGSYVAPPFSFAFFPVRDAAFACCLKVIKRPLQPSGSISQM